MFFLRKFKIEKKESGDDLGSFVNDILGQYKREGVVRGGFSAEFFISKFLQPKMKVAFQDGLS